MTHELTQFNPAENFMLGDIAPKRKTKSQTCTDLRKLLYVLRDMDVYDGHRQMPCFFVKAFFAQFLSKIYIGSILLLL